MKNLLTKDTARLAGHPEGGAIIEKIRDKNLYTAGESRHYSSKLPSSCINGALVQ